MIADLLHNPPANRTIGDDLSYLKSLGLIDSAGIGRGAKWFLTINPKHNGADNGAEKSD